MAAAFATFGNGGRYFEPYSYYKVTDRYGRSYHKESYMVADLFLENKDLLDTAYYKEKLPKYWEDYHEGTRKLVSFMTLWKAVSRIMAEYGITEVYAYNAYFDLSGLNRTLRYITKSRYRYFFPYGTKVFCIWHIACQTILLQKSFFKFVDKYNLLNNKGNVPTSAEICYKYITYNPDFEEEHTGLADVEIETLILAKCLAQQKRVLEKELNDLLYELGIARVIGSGIAQKRVYFEVFIFDKEEFKKAVVKVVSKLNLPITYLAY